MLHVRQTESQLIPIMKQTSLINILEIPQKFWKCQHVQPGRTPNKPKNANLLTASTRLVGTGFFYVTISAMVKAPSSGLSATGSDQEGGTCILRMLGQ